MAESLVQVTEGSGKKLHTWSYTVGANTVEDEVTVPGPYPWPSYFITGQSATNTANDHIIQIMAGASLKVRLVRLRIEQGANATAATVITFQIWRLSTAGTGGTAVTARPFDTAAAAAGATGMTLPTAKGTETVELMRTSLLLRQAISATGAQVDDSWEWTQLPGQQPIIIPAGVTNGLAIKNTAALGAAGSILFTLEFVETAF